MKAKLTTVIKCATVFGAIVAAAVVPLRQPPTSSAAGKHKISNHAQITVLPGTTSSSISPSYLGFAVETSTICQILSLDLQKPVEFEQLFRNLGPGVLKIGGRSSEFALWKSIGIASCSAKDTVVTAAELTALFGFAKRIGWKVLWGLPLKVFNPKMASYEALAVSLAGGPNLLAFSIGNEPDLYASRGDRPSTWSFKDYLTQWQTVRNAVLHRVPKAKFVGPDDCCGTSYFASFAQGAANQVQALSFHFYAGSGAKMTGAVARSHLLSRGAAQGFRNRAGSFWKDDTNGGHVPLYLTEINSYPVGGVRGVSNTFTATLWLSDILFSGAMLNVSLANIQEARGNAPYDAISDTGLPTAVYYAMLFFQIASGGDTNHPGPSHGLQLLLNTKLDLTAYALRAADGSLRVVLVNKDSVAASAQVNSGSLYKSAGVYRLSAPSLTSTTGVTLGGKGISSLGTWSGVSASLSLSGKPSSATLKVPADSAVCVVFR